MKAYVLHGVDDLRYEEVNTPGIGGDEVLVKVHAAGICGSDIPRIYQTGAHTHPLIPGHEFSGEVTEVGAEVSAKWLNKRVGIFPLIPCHNCMPCKKMQYEMCRNYSYLGSRRDGGFAEFAAVPAANLLELPEQVSYEAAAMLEPMAVAVHAIKKMNVTKNDSVVVCGLGTIGMFVAMFLKQEGIEKLYVIGNKEFQRKNMLKLGIEDRFYCDSKNENVEKWILLQTNQIGADKFFECVGKNETVKEAVNLTAPAGKVMLVGNPYSDINLEKDVYWKILRNQLTVMGTWNSSFTGAEADDWHYVLQLLAEKKINPVDFISHKFNMCELEKGLHIMRDKTEDYVKIMCQLPVKLLTQTDES